MKALKFFRIFSGSVWFQQDCYHKQPTQLERFEKHWFKKYHYWFTTGRLLCSKARLIRLLTASRRVLLNTKRCFNISFCGADGAPKCVRRCWCVILDSVIRPVLCFFVWLSKNLVNYWSILNVYIDKWCWHPSNLILRLKLVFVSITL